MMYKLHSCKLCPRQCGSNREDGKRGFCGANNKVMISKAYLHQWEEPCISGKNGSGTVFFANCSLKCVFCQNKSISTDGFGKEISIKRLSEIFIELQQKGATNINLVTPGHYVPHIIESIILAKRNGLTIPIVYNTSSYESLETIKSLSGHIDVFLPDLKYYSDKYSVMYSTAPHYFEIACSAIEEMFKQVGEAVFDSDGNMIKGVIIRHLMLPGLLFDSKKIIDYVYKTFGNKVYLSLMNQYTPMTYNEKYASLNKTISSKNYNVLIDYAIKIGITNGFIQDEGTASESFIPRFDLEGIWPQKWKLWELIPIASFII